MEIMFGEVGATRVVEYYADVQTPPGASGRPSTGSGPTPTPGFISVLRPTKWPDDSPVRALRRNGPSLIDCPTQEIKVWGRRHVETHTQSAGQAMDMLIIGLLSAGPAGMCVGLRY
jgi:hypothetical protein